MSVPLWLLVLGATLLVQSAASFMNQCLPVVAPLLTASTGMAPERIGNLSSLSSAGTVLFLLLGSAVLARLGPVRTMQCGLMVSVVAIALAATGWWPVLFVSSLLLGLGYGPTPPAGSRLLAATAPTQHRTLIFSVKQAGAPAGGALAGLLVAPIAARVGWAPALLLAVGAGLLAAALISPLRTMMDVERDRWRSIHPRALLNRQNVFAPVRALGAHTSLISLTVLAVSFSIAQGTLFSFSVTYLTHRGLDLGEAGVAYACLQSAGVIARIFLGWFADRTGRPAENLTAQAYLAGIAVIAYALLPDTPSLLLASTIAAITGFLGASWNGIYLAEVSRLSPPDCIADVTSGSTLFTFLGYVAGPSLFAFAVPTVGWAVPFVVVGAQLMAMALIQTILLLRRRSEGERN